MDVMERLRRAAVIPAAALDDVGHAVPAAGALYAGGIDVIEVTFRTAAAPEAIRAVAEQCPNMLVGAGTVLTLEQCRTAVDCGAKFIVAPGLNPEVVRWCTGHGIAVIPGCATPTEIMAALQLGVEVVKFFPASVYGGLAAMKALSGPFGTVRFIPTGGVNSQNIGAFMAAPFVYAVGGSWVCPPGEIRAGNFSRITALCQEARAAALGFEVAHIGMNTACPEQAQEVGLRLARAFGLDIRGGRASNFVSSRIEIMNTPYLGENGHIAIATNSIPLAIAELERKGLACDMQTAKYQAGRMTAVYLKDEFGGFAIHLLQK